MLGGETILIRIIADLSIVHLFVGCFSRFRHILFLYYRTWLGKLKRKMLWQEHPTYSSTVLFIRATIK